MSDTTDTTNHQRITALEAENTALKARIAELEARLQINSAPPQSLTQTPPTATPELSAEEYLRYGRQLILPQIGLSGQQKLKSTRVLIIGLGGLGCPAATYLSSAGIGTLGLLDHDLVELSNLHRQILHTHAYIGQPKVVSAIDRLRANNPNVNYIPHVMALDRGNALQIIGGYDLVLDCTDHPRVRYLVSDVAVVLGKTVVSASALKMEGQLVVMEMAGRGPCYRCYWPKPPPRESVVSCGEGGVLGPVVGVMGVLQALEAIKIIASGCLEYQQSPISTSISTSISISTEQKTTDTATTPIAQPEQEPEPEPASMLFFSSYSPTPFKTLRMKGRRAECISCGHPSDPAAKITEDNIPDYEDFCGPGKDAVLLDAKDRRSVRDMQEIMNRDKNVFGITRVKGSRNVPFVLWQRGGKVPEEFWRAVEEGAEEGVEEGAEGNKTGDNGTNGEGDKNPNQDNKKEVIILCRRGNDSQEAAKMVMEDPRAKDWKVTDVVGGITEWAKRLGGVVEY
ncbi:hypothetical protein BZA77DRAFT_336981 [Pyronema omphalodes]|nr:hypothetical protein BZA77DRAFT_336981 [Pyronema omphalodes]